MTATTIGNTTAAIRKLGLDPAAAMEEIFDLYDRNEIKFVRSPDKTLLFQTRDLTDEDVQNIISNITEKVEKRLIDFELFVELIETKADPVSVLQKRFGHAN